MKKWLIALLFAAGAIISLWISLYVMLIGGLIQFVDALFNPATVMREHTVLFGLLRMLFGPFIGIGVFATVIELVAVLRKGK